MFSYAKVIKKIEVAKFIKGFFKCFVCQEWMRGGWEAAVPWLRSVR